MSSMDALRRRISRPCVSCPRTSCPGKFAAVSAARSRAIAIGTIPRLSNSATTKRPVCPVAPNTATAGLLFVLIVDYSYATDLSVSVQYVQVCSMSRTDVLTWSWSDHAEDRGDIGRPK